MDFLSHLKSNLDKNQHSFSFCIFFPELLLNLSKINLNFKRKQSASILETICWRTKGWFVVKLLWASQKLCPTWSGLFCISYLVPPTPIGVQGSQSPPSRFGYETLIFVSIHSMPMLRYSWKCWAMWYVVALPFVFHPAGSG